MNQPERRAIWSAFVVALGGFIFGLDIVLISGGVSAIRTEFLLSDDQVGMVVAAAGWGVLPALLLVGPLTNHIGRKNTLIVIAALYVVSAIGSAFASDWVTLSFARALGGMAFTSLSVASMYIGEIAPARMRGKMVSINQLNIGIGIFIAFLVNLGISTFANSGSMLAEALAVKDSMWRWMLGVEILPAIIWLVLLAGIPKSPRWLFEVGREEEARDVLTQMVPGERLEDSMKEIRESAHGEDGLSILGGLKELFTTHLNKALMVGLLVSFLQPLTGINNLLYYAPIVFEQAGTGTNAAFVSSVVIGLIAMISTGIAITIIDNMGRRILLVAGLSAAAVCLLVAGWGFSQASYVIAPTGLEAIAQGLQIEKLQPILGTVYESDVAFKNALVETLGFDAARQFEGALIQHSVQGLNAPLIIAGLLGFVAAFNASIGPIMWVLFSEIFPTRVRGVAISGCALITSLVSAGLANIFPRLLNGVGVASVFLMFGGIIAIGLVLVFFLVPETKNKSIEQIENLFKGQA